LSPCDTHRFATGYRFAQPILQTTDVCGFGTTSLKGRHKSPAFFDFDENGARAVETLPDQLQDHLRLVFVGTAASRRSADVGHYYAHPGNRFWRTIHEVGITPRRYEPNEFPSLLKLGIGFTDMCKAGAGMDHEALNFPIDLPAFREKMLRYRPKTIAFTSKKAASLFYGRPTKAVALGRQPPQEDFPIVFVLASPSGAATRYWSAQPWRELADSINS
jgi:double-stranded uracil-DNA glycosylase